MKKKDWGLVFVTAESLSRVRQIKCRCIFLIVFLLISISGFIGMGRLLWFTGTYISARYDVFEAYRENRSLMMKVKFITKYIDQENDKIRELITFEDNIRLQYGMENISEDVRRAGVGGRPSPEEILLSNMLDPVLINAETVRESLSVMLRKTKLQDSTLSQVTSNVHTIHKRWAQRPAIMPTNGRITSPYGNRFHPIEGRVLFHEGMDIANKIGTQVYAAADGIIKFVGIRDNYGRTIAIEHVGSKCETIYAHLKETVVSKGQTVKRGDLIGIMGNSGRSTGPHLHYEVRIDNHSVNPQNYILPVETIID